jgi:hypothetical protein
MNFQLRFQIPSFQQKINYSHKLLFTGSCFAEEIGGKIRSGKFNTLINPHGVLYNPLSIAGGITRYINKKLLREEDLFFANDCWNSLEHHSRFSDPDKSHCLNLINKNIEEAHNQLQAPGWLFITFGSAFYYLLKEGKRLAGNCHKIPQEHFSKEICDVKTIVAVYNELLNRLNKMNPDLNVVFTVSPVRYIRDGIIENNLSKSVLIESVHQLVKTHGNAFYFPAYEIVIDELRDYRFFKADLVHPNELAIDYVFEKMADSMMSSECKNVLKRVDEINNLMKHRPFNTGSAKHLEFMAASLKKCIQLKTDLPELDLTREINHFQNTGAD